MSKRDNEDRRSGSRSRSQSNKSGDSAEIESLVESEQRRRSSAFKKKKREELVRKIEIWICRVIPVAAVIFAVGYIIYLVTDTSNWETNGDAENKEKLRREKQRGAFVSVVISILLNIIGAAMFYIKVRESLVITNYGFILGPVIGFILDQGIGTDAGCSIIFTSDGFKYSLGSLISGNFVRYIITVFLDLFISNPLQDVMKRQVKKAGILCTLEDGDGKPPWMQKYDHFVALNFPSILQSIVAFVTFNAYTNQTRFAWAYPASTLNRDLRIPPGTIMLATAATGVMYLVFYTVMDSFSDRVYYGVTTKLMYVIFILMVLYGLNHTDSIEAPVEGEKDNNITEVIEDFKWVFGMLMLTGFILYGLVYPISTRLGCCGLWKPEQEELDDREDHMIDEPRELMLSEPMLDAIAERLRQKERRKTRQVNKIFSVTHN